MLDRPQQQPNVSPDRSAAPLVMLPGTLCDSRVFAPLLVRLGVRASIPALAGATRVTDMARRILDESPERFSLCGFSLGAIVALEIVAQAPKRVERLALIGCNPCAMPVPARSVREAVSQSEFVAQMGGRGDAARRTLLGDMAASLATDVYAQQTAMTLTRADSRPRLTRIAVPTLVLCGAKDDICPPELSRDMAAAIPGARLAIVAGAGHYVTLDNPRSVATELAAWLSMPKHDAKERQ